jgi:hypothetical protein
VASKSQLKKIAARKREREHELIRQKKEADKKSRMSGMHPDQIAARKRKSESVYRPRRSSVKVDSVVRSGIVYRETPYYPSVTSNSSGTAGTEKRETNKYTGDKLIGIAMMHKSNLVPVFNPEHAKDVSSMRRN